MKTKSKALLEPLQSWGRRSEWTVIPIFKMCSWFLGEIISSCLSASPHVQRPRNSSLEHSGSQSTSNHDALSEPAVSKDALWQAYEQLQEEYAALQRDIDRRSNRDSTTPSNSVFKPISQIELSASPRNLYPQPLNVSSNASRAKSKHVGRNLQTSKPKRAPRP